MEYWEEFDETEGKSEHPLYALHEALINTIYGRNPHNAVDSEIIEELDSKTEADWDWLVGFESKKIIRDTIRFDSDQLSGYDEERWRGDFFNLTAGKIKENLNNSPSFILSSTYSELTEDQADRAYEELTDLLVEYMEENNNLGELLQVDTGLRSLTFDLQEWSTRFDKHVKPNLAVELSKSQYMGARLRQQVEEYLHKQEELKVFIKKQELPNAPYLLIEKFSPLEVYYHYEEYQNKDNAPMTIVEASLIEDDLLLKDFGSKILRVLLSTVRTSNFVLETAWEYDRLVLIAPFGCMHNLDVETPNIGKCQILYLNYPEMTHAKGTLIDFRNFVSEKVDGRPRYTPKFHHLGKKLIKRLFDKHELNLNADTWNIEASSVRLDRFLGSDLEMFISPNLPNIEFLEVLIYENTKFNLTLNVIAPKFRKGKDNFQIRVTALLIDIPYGNARLVNIHEKGTEDNFAYEFFGDIKILLFGLTYKSIAEYFKKNRGSKGFKFDKVQPYDILRNSPKFHTDQQLFSFLNIFRYSKIKHLRKNKTYRDFLDIYRYGLDLTLIPSWRVTITSDPSQSEKIINNGHLGFDVTPKDAPIIQKRDFNTNVKIFCVNPQGTFPNQILTAKWSNTISGRSDFSDLNKATTAFSRNYNVFKCYDVIYETCCGMPTLYYADSFMQRFGFPREDDRFYKDSNLIAYSYLYIYIPQIGGRFSEHLQKGGISSTFPLGSIMASFVGENQTDISPQQFLKRGKSLGMERIYPLRKVQKYEYEVRSNIPWLNIDVKKAGLDPYGDGEQFNPFLNYTPKSLDPACRYLYSFIDFYTRPLALLYQVLHSKTSTQESRKNPFLDLKHKTFSFTGNTTKWQETYKGLIKASQDTTFWEGSRANPSAYPTFKEDDIPQEIEYFIQNADVREYQDLHKVGHDISLNYSELGERTSYLLRYEIYGDSSDILPLAFKEVAVEHEQKSLLKNTLEACRLGEGTHSTTVEDTQTGNLYENTKFSRRLLSCINAISQFWSFNMPTLLTNTDDKFSKAFIFGEDKSIRHVVDLGFLFENPVVGKGLKIIEKNKSINVGGDARKPVTIANLGKNPISYEGIRRGLKTFDFRPKASVLGIDSRSKPSPYPRLPLGAFLTTYTWLIIAKRAFLSNLGLDGFGAKIVEKGDFEIRHLTVNEDGDKHFIKADDTEVRQRFERATASYGLCIGESQFDFVEEAQFGDLDVWMFFDSQTQNNFATIGISSTAIHDGEFEKFEIDDDNGESNSPAGTLPQYISEVTDVYHFTQEDFYKYIGIFRLSVILDFFSEFYLTKVNSVGDIADAYEEYNESGVSPHNNRQSNVLELTNHMERSAEYNTQFVKLLFNEMIYDEGQPHYFPNDGWLRYAFGICETLMQAFRPYIPDVHDIDEVISFHAFLLKYDPIFFGAILPDSQTLEKMKHTYALIYEVVAKELELKEADLSRFTYGFDVPHVFKTNPSVRNLDAVRDFLNQPAETFYWRFETMLSDKTET